MSIDELLPDGLSPTPEQSEILLEIAYLVTAVDGRLADEEVAAFALVAARLRGKESVTTAEVDELIEEAHGIRAHACHDSLPRRSVEQLGLTAVGGSRASAISRNRDSVHL